MRTTISSTIISLGLALAMWPQSGQTQSERDFVFADLEGHLVIRFAGTGASALDPSQAEEVLNAELSSMVHDRLRADLLFEAEPRDSEWAASMAPQIEEHVKRAGPEFSAIFTECRAGSCRVIMEQPRHWTVPEHQAVLDTLQKSLEAFIAARRQHFEPIFMIVAYYQEYETPHIKAFLRRTEQASAVQRKGSSRALLAKRGRRIVNVVPLSAVDSTSTVPPCALATCCTMYSPSPSLSSRLSHRVRVLSPRVSGSKITASISGGIGAP